jgi:hypothetical protein
MAVPPEPVSKVKNEVGAHALFQKMLAQKKLYLEIRDDGPVAANHAVHTFLQAREAKTSVQMVMFVRREIKTENSSQKSTPMWLSLLECQVLTFHPTEEGYVTYL